jgi:hypothetical protein
MLAYVFWHWPNRDVDRASYEEGLREFHRAFSAAKPRGFRDSFVFRIRNAPWLPATTESYEDWYIVEDSAALDVINEAAVSYPSKESHDRAAQRAAGGTAGLYRLRRGEINFSLARFAVWLSKPAGQSYDDFYASLAHVTNQAGVALWGRQMTLGPTPEFCLLTPEAALSDSGSDFLSLPLDSIWNTETDA